MQKQQHAQSAPARLLVSNTEDSGPYSLRYAIDLANSREGVNFIDFNIPLTDPNYYESGGYFTVSLLSPLPDLTDSSGVIIDGTTQATNNGDTNTMGPEIEIVPGSNTFSGPFFSLVGNNNTIKGFSLQGGDSAAISVSSNYNTISQNYIGVDPNGLDSWKNAYGIKLLDPNSDNIIIDNIISSTNNGVLMSGGYLNLITHNIIGVNVNKMAFNNFTKPDDFGNGGHGIYLQNNCVENTIDRNIIADNHSNGIYLEGVGTRDNLILHNTIRDNGWHGIGIYDGAYSNSIGSAGYPTGGNYIFRNGWSGIVMVNSANDNFVIYNGVFENNFNGIGIVDSSDNFILYNSIRDNGVKTASAGIRVRGVTSIHNKWFQNKIFDNNNTGIQFEDGANEGIAPPTILSASCSSVRGTACPNCNVEIYSDYGDQGRIFEYMVESEPDGTYRFDGYINGPNVTAFHTDANENSSSFSLPYQYACVRIFLPFVER